MAASRPVHHLLLQLALLAAAAAPVLLLFPAGALADPDITTDFVVPPDVDPKSLDGSFFTFQGLRNGVTLGPGEHFGAAKVSEAQLPSLTGLGVSTALLRYEAGGINPPHTHPRATEVLLVLEGSLSVGVVDTGNKLYENWLFPGDIFVFPKGLPHYQYNAGPNGSVAVAYAAFSSANPGTVSLPKSLFGSKIDDVVLEKAFKVSGHVVAELKAPFATSQPPSIPPTVAPAPGADPVGPAPEAWSPEPGH